MRVETIYLKDTGPFAELRLDFQPKMSEDKADIHILVGQNGTGKSTILSTIAAAYYPYQLESEFYKRLNNNKSWAELKIDSLYIALAWKSAFSEKERSLLNPDFMLQDSNILASASGKPTFWSNITQFPKLTNYINNVNQLKADGSNLNIKPLNFSAFAYSGYRGFGDVKLKAIEENQGLVLTDALSFNKNSQTNYEKLIKWLALTKSKAALAAYRNDQLTASKREESIKRIELIVSNIINKPIKFEITDEPLAVNLKVDGRTSNFDVLPDGLKSILGWVTDLMMRMELVPWENNLPIFERQFLLLLDEIEVHLHPTWQRKILPVLQKLFPKAQIILSTHSPFVVGYVSDAWVYPLHLNEQGNAYLSNPIKSKAGVSYPAIVEEVFGIAEDFDINTEELLDKFEQKRNDYLQGKVDLSALQNFGAEIAKDSIEVSNIVSREIRQAERMRKQQGTPSV